MDGQKNMPPRALDAGAACAARETAHAISVSRMLGSSSVPRWARMNAAAEQHDLGPLSVPCELHAAPVGVPCSRAGHASPDGGGRRAAMTQAEGRRARPASNVSYLHVAERPRPGPPPRPVVVEIHDAPRRPGAAHAGRASLEGDRRLLPRADARPTLPVAADADRHDEERADGRADQRRRPLEGTTACGAVYVSRFELDPESPLVKRDIDDFYEMHRTVMRLFPEVNTIEEMPRRNLRILHREEVDEASGAVVLIVQSSLPPTPSRLPDGYLKRADVGDANPVTKKLEVEVLSAGMELLFRLRGKTVQTQRAEPGSRGGQRRYERYLSGREEQLRWLEKRAAKFGFRVDRVEVTPIPVRRHRRDCVVGGALFAGALTIVDPDAFREGLSRGVGGGKAFGCGMLSLRRV